MPSVAETAYLDIVLKAQEVFWAGLWPPLARMAASTALFDAAQDHRLPPDMHGRFEVVLLLEHDLAGHKQWPLILDEALRLLRHDGVLVLRYGRSPLLTAAALKHQIHGWASGAVEPVFEHTSRDGQTQCGVRLTMPERPRPQLAGFSFALVSDGRRPAGIEVFIDSVRRLYGLERIGYEILVCGPESISVAAQNWGSDCRIVHDPGHFPELGWITNKKNLCVEAAAYENIVVAHDRYVLAPDFLREMVAFGADFDVLVCRQTDTDGGRFPDWVTLGSAWSDTSPAMLPYGEYCRNLYVNGGLIIAKRETLRRIGWNALIFWAQAEDVELTRRFQARGIVPRLARKVVAISSTARPGYLQGFETFPAAARTYFLSQSADAHGEVQAPYYRLGTEIGLVDPLDSLCAAYGVRLGGDWTTGPLGALLTGPEIGEIFLRAAGLPSGDLELLLRTDQVPEVFTLLLNGHKLVPWADAEGRLRARITTEMAVSATFRLHLRLHNPAESLVIRSLELRPVAAASLAPGDRLAFQTGGNGVSLLAEGWSLVEDWGIWSIGKANVVYLPLPPALGHDQWLEVEGIPYAAPGWPVNIIGLALNSIPIGHVRLDIPGKVTSFRFCIPESLLSSSGPYRLSFHPQHTVSPASIGQAADPRELALGLQHIVYLGSAPE